MTTCKTIKCYICGKVYEWFSMMVGDQSKCPECRMAERAAIERKSTSQELERRQSYFGA